MNLNLCKVRNCTSLVPTAIRTRLQVQSRRIDACSNLVFVQTRSYDRMSGGRANLLRIVMRMLCLCGKPLKSS